VTSSKKRTVRLPLTRARGRLFGQVCDSPGESAPSALDRDRQAGLRAIEPATGPATATFTVANTGSRTGTTVVPVYVHQPVSDVVAPPQRLVGWARVTLDAGQSQTVHVAGQSQTVHVAGQSQTVHVAGQSQTVHVSFPVSVTTSPAGAL
jgi:Fibronectin type III-like domain